MTGGQPLPGGLVQFRDKARCPLPALRPDREGRLCNRKIMDLPRGWLALIRRAVEGALETAWEEPGGIHRCGKCERDLELRFVMAHPTPPSFPVCTDIDPDAAGGILLGGT